MQTSTRLPLVLVIGLTIAVVGCSGGATGQSPSSAASAATSSPPASAAGSAAASLTPPGSPEEAAELVLEQNPMFAGFGPKNPDAIGQCCWHDVTQTSDGYRVVVHAGWGDCPAGCIEKHEWTFDVTSAGKVTLVEESGDPVPPGGIPDGGM